jgi:hypothetical protein
MVLRRDRIGDVALTSVLLIETGGDGGSNRLVGDTENIQATDGTGVLGGLKLGVIAVSGDGKRCKTRKSLSSWSGLRRRFFRETENKVRIAIKTG